MDTSHTNKMQQSKNVPTQGLIREGLEYLSRTPWVQDPSEIKRGSLILPQLWKLGAFETLPGYGHSEWTVILFSLDLFCFQNEYGLLEAFAVSINGKKTQSIINHKVNKVN